MKKIFLLLCQIFICAQVVVVDRIRWVFAISLKPAVGHLVAVLYHLVRHLSFVEHFVTIQEIMVISHLELLEMRQIFITEEMALVSLLACDQSA
jgi:hypothetical protein